MADSVPSNAGEDEPIESGDSPASDEGRDDGSRRARRKPKKKRHFLVELAFLVVFGLAFAFLIQVFLARVYMIPSSSMESTLHGCTGCYGDKVLVDKITYDFSDPEPGEVVVFKGPEPWTEQDTLPQRSGNSFLRGLQDVGSWFGLTPPDEQDFVKRIIAVGGQTVQCCDDQNHVVVDGKPLDEPYIHWVDPNEQVQKRFDPVQVPQGTVWVMGDNRNDSCDSTCQGGGGLRGVVPVDNIIGKARVIVLPPSRWGGVSDHNPQAGAQAMGLPDAPAGGGLVLIWPAALLARRAGLRDMFGRPRGRRER